MGLHELNFELELTLYCLHALSKWPEVCGFRPQVTFRQAVQIYFKDFW